jgi:hypothetical protein
MPTPTEQSTADRLTGTDTPIYDDLARAVPGFADLAGGALAGTDPAWTMPEKPNSR